MNRTSATIIASLKKLQCPSYNSRWLGPFEQLVGAGYALLAAIQRRIYSRNLEQYNPRVQKKVTSHIESFFSGKQMLDARGFDDWLAGFYFNSGIQRIVWAAERLLLTCAAANCPCGSRKTEDAVGDDRPRWPDILEGALQRLDHLQNDDGLKLAHCQTVREQFIIRDDSGKKREYRRNDSLDSSKVLAMLRYDVNNRKHRVYERSVLRDHQSAGKGDGKTWSSSGADLQMNLAIQAFTLVCDAYEELRRWNPGSDTGENA
ncbi:MAG: hypothetical protein ACYDDI_13825 [Candidatus Acidiferrales bacterium]